MKRPTKQFRRVQAGAEPHHPGGETAADPLPWDGDPPAEEERTSDGRRVAVRMSAAPIELTACQRAVEGVEQEMSRCGLPPAIHSHAGGMARLLILRRPGPCPPPL